MKYYYYSEHQECRDSVKIGRSRYVSTREWCVEAGTLLYWRYYVEEYVEYWLVGDRVDEYAKACHALCL